MIANHRLRRDLDNIAKGVQNPMYVDPPQKSIAKQIANPPKKAFDYLVIRDDDGQMYFVVDGKMPSNKAASMFNRYRPHINPLGVYDTGFCRYNVVTQRYELCEEGKGAFPVHIFYMED